MKENKKINIEQMDLDDLLDQTLSVTLKTLPKEQSSVAIINAESIENSAENLKIPKSKDDIILLPEFEEEEDATTAPVILTEPKKETEPVILASPEEEDATTAPVILTEPKKELNNTQAQTSVNVLKENFSVQNLSLPKQATESNGLQTAQYLNIAQDKIIELQKNIEILHEENANIAAAGELWKKRSAEFKQDMLEIKDKYSIVQEAKDTEQKIFTMSIDKQNKKMQDLKKDLSESDLLTEEKLKTYKLIASDLENRIEIIEREKLTLLDGKNNFISDLQKQINTLKKINTDDKKKLKDISTLMRTKEQALRNTIKLLRQTLISLELGDAETPKLALVS